MSKEELLVHVITNLILEYRISMETVCKTFNVDEHDIYDKLMNNSNYLIKDALMYVLDYETKEPGLIDQKKSKLKMSMFLTKLHMAQTPKDKLEVIKELSDNSSIDAIKNKNANQVTEEDIINLTNYRYKYALTKSFICDHFPVTTKKLTYWEAKLDDDFKKKIDYLNAYNDKIRNPHRGITRI